MASYTDENGKPIKTTEQLQSWYKSQGYDWEKLDPELKQQALTGIGEQDRGVIGAARDVGVSVLGGVYSGTVGTIGSLGSAALNLFGNEKTAGDLARATASGRKAIESLKTEAGEVKGALRAKRIDEAGKEGGLSGIGSEAWQTIKEVVNDPASAAEVVGDTLGQLAPALLTGGASLWGKAAVKTADVTYKKALASGATAEVAKAQALAAQKLATEAAGKLTAKAAVVQDAATTGSQSYLGAYEKLMSLPDKTWIADPEVYERVINKGEDINTVKNEKALQLSTKTGGASAGISLAVGKLVGNPLEKAFGDIISGGTGKVTTKVVGKQAGKSALEESIEEPLTGALPENIAAQQIDPTQSLTAGLGSSAVLGAIGGAGGGGGATLARGALAPQTARIDQTITSTPVAGATPVALGETKVIVPDEGIENAVQVESSASQVLPTPEAGQVGVGLPEVGQGDQVDQVSAEEGIKAQEEVNYEMTRDSLRSRLEEQILQDRLAQTGDTTVQDVQQQVQAQVTSPEEIAAAKAKIEDAFLADLIAGDESSKATQQAAVEQMQSVSDAETFESRVAETDARVRDSRVMTRLQTLLDSGAGFGSTAILDIDQKLQAIGEQPLNEQERARIQSIAGAYQTFMAQPALPQGAAPVIDAGAQNAPLEALIPERKPKGALSARTTNVPRGTGLAARGANARANAQSAGAVADTTDGAPNRVGDGNQKPPAKGLKAPSNVSQSVTGKSSYTTSFTEAVGNGDADINAAATQAQVIVPDAGTIPVKIGKLPDGTPAAYDRDSGTIVLAEGINFKQDTLLEVLLEERLHAIDSVFPDRSISSNSEMFFEGGPVFEEARRQFEQNGVFGEFLQYPMGHGLDANRTAAELFARIGVLYAAEPRLAEQFFPDLKETYNVRPVKDFAVNEAIRDQIPEQSGGLGAPASRLAKQRSPRGDGLSVQRLGKLGKSRPADDAERLYNARQQAARSIGTDLKAVESGVRYKGAMNSYQPASKTETIDVDGVQRPTMNSNGRPIETDPEKLRNFWRWFGDSKVVDAEGKPSVVYHASISPITEFKPKGYGTAGDHSYFYFAASESWSKKFAKESLNVSKPSMHRVYLAINNPLDLRGQANTPKGWMDFFGGAGVGIGDKMQEKLTRAPANQEIAAWQLLRFDTPTNGAMRESMIAAGYDGLIMSDVARGKMDNTTYVTFNPTQIKSTIGNQGAYNQTNPSITDEQINQIVEDSNGAIIPKCNL
jgi:hypothetical protein